MTQQSGLFSSMMLPMHMFSHLLATNLNVSEGITYDKIKSS